MLVANFRKQLLQKIWLMYAGAWELFGVLQVLSLESNQALAILAMVAIAAPISAIL